MYIFLKQNSFNIVYSSFNFWTNRDHWLVSCWCAFNTDFSLSSIYLFTFVYNCFYFVLLCIKRRKLACTTPICAKMGKLDECAFQKRCKKSGWPALAVSHKCNRGKKTGFHYKPSSAALHPKVRATTSAVHSFEFCTSKATAVQCFPENENRQVNP